MIERRTFSSREIRYSAAAATPDDNNDDHNDDDCLARDD